MNEAQLLLEDDEGREFTAYIYLYKNVCLDSYQYGEISEDLMYYICQQMDALNGSYYSTGYYTEESPLLHSSHNICQNGTLSDIFYDGDIESFVKHLTSVNYVSYYTAGNLPSEADFKQWSSPFEFAARLNRCRGTEEMNAAISLSKGYGNTNINDKYAAFVSDTLLFNYSIYEGNSEFSFDHSSYSLYYAGKYLYHTEDNTSIPALKIYEDQDIPVSIIRKTGSQSNQKYPQQYMRISPVYTITGVGNNNSNLLLYIPVQSFEGSADRIYLATITTDENQEPSYSISRPKSTELIKYDNCYMFIMRYTKNRFFILLEEE